MERKEDSYSQFLKFLDEDYDWLAFSLRNVCVSRDQLSVSSGRSSTPETVSMSMMERDRDRMRRQQQRVTEDQDRHEFRDR